MIKTRVSSVTQPCRPTGKTQNQTPPPTLKGLCNSSISLSASWSTSRSHGLWQRGRTPLSTLSGWQLNDASYRQDETPTHPGNTYRVGLQRLQPMEASGVVQTTENALQALDCKLPTRRDGTQKDYSFKSHPKERLYDSETCHCNTPVTAWMCDVGYTSSALR